MFSKEDILSMDIKTLIEHRDSGKVKMADMQKATERSDTHIRNKLISVGYTYDNKAKKYNKNEWWNEENDKMIFANVVSPDGTSGGHGSYKRTTADGNSSIEIKGTEMDTNSTVDYSLLESIDKLIEGGSATKDKKQVSVYLDSNVDTWLNTHISKKSKSQFIQDCIMFTLKFRNIDIDK